MEGENAGRRPPGQGLWAENNGRPRLCLWAPHWEQTQHTPVQGEFLYPGVEASLLRGAGGRGSRLALMLRVMRCFDLSFQHCCVPYRWEEAKRKWSARAFQNPGESNQTSSLREPETAFWWRWQGQCSRQHGKVTD